MLGMLAGLFVRYECDAYRRFLTAWLRDWLELPYLACETMVEVRDGCSLLRELERTAVFTLTSEGKWGSFLGRGQLLIGSISRLACKPLRINFGCV